MSEFVWLCSRCGNVGFHSEACIATTNAAQRATSPLVIALPDSLTAGEVSRILVDVLREQERIARGREPEEEMQP